MFVIFFISTLFRYFWLDPKVTKKSRLRALRFALPPFEGGEGGMFLCVRPVVIQSEAKNLFPLPRGIPHCVRNDKGGVRNDKLMVNC